jgi:hypothetical protein
MHRPAVRFGNSIFSLVTFCLIPHYAITGEAKTSPNAHPPKDVLRAGSQVATRKHQQVVARGEPDIYPHEPKLIAKQRITGFPSPKQTSWLLLYSVAEVGPRAHTPISQLTIVSERESHVIVAIPSENEPAPDDPSELIEQADDALLVEIARGRYALAISHGGQAKIPGDVTVFAINRDFSLKELWIYPGHGERRRIGSTIYFVRDPKEKATLLAVRQDEVIYEGPKVKLSTRDLLYRLDAATDRYEQAEIDPAQLAKLLKVSERNRRNLSIDQRPEMGLENARYEKQEQDRMLNEVYGKLLRKLPSKVREALSVEQREWLTKRDQFDFLDDRNKFVADRTRELTERLNRRK